MKPHYIITGGTAHTHTVTQGNTERMMMTWNLPLKLSQHLLLLLLLSAPLLVVSLASENEDQSSAKIISNYFELEEAAITNNTGNREKLYRVFFSPNLPSPKSVMVNYQVNNSGKLVPYRIPFNNKCKNNETWYWMSSAVYFIIDPLVLDRHALYILSWFPPFTEQLQPSLNLTIPPIEEKAAFNLLQQFTMTLRVYASGAKVRNDLGFVRRQCGGVIVSTMRDGRRDMDRIGVSLIVLLAVGVFIIAALLLIISAVVLRKRFPTMVKRSQQATYNHYGLFWGATIVSGLVNNLILAAQVVNFKRFVDSGVPEHLAIFAVECAFIALIVFCNLILALVLTAGNAFNAPDLFVCLLAPLCCGSSQKARYALTALSLWVMLVAAHAITAHSFFVFLALLASPEEVILKAILYVFALFCSIHLLAVLFTIGKIKKKANKSILKRVAAAVGQGISFTLLMAGSMCLGILITAAGQLETFSPNLGSTLTTLSRFMSPILLSLVGWSLRSISTKWLKHMQADQPAETPLDEIPPATKPSPLRRRYSTRIHELVSPLMVITTHKKQNGESTDVEIEL